MHHHRPGPRRVQYDAKAAGPGGPGRRPGPGGRPMGGRGPRHRGIGSFGKGKGAGAPVTKERSAHKKVVRIEESVLLQGLAGSMGIKATDVLRKLQELHNLGVIYITHDLSTVRYFSEYIFVMYAGQIVEFAPMEELLNDPKHPYTLALLAASSDPNADNALVMREVPRGEPPSLVNPPTGCRFHPRCPQFMEGICDVKEPPDFETGPSHRVKCWLYE